MKVLLSSPSPNPSPQRPGSIQNQNNPKTKWSIGTGADNKILWATTTTTTTPPPITFKHEGVLWEKSTISMNVLGWSPLATWPKKLPCGQWDQGYGVVLHDQGEGYQQTKLLEVGVAQVVKEVFCFQIPYWDQNSIILLVIGPIPFLGLDLIDPRSSLHIYLYKSCQCSVGLH